MVFDFDGKITIRILMDKTVLEIFGNRGEAPICGMIFPDADSVMNTLSIEGAIAIESFSLYEMSSIWHKDKSVLPDTDLT